MLKRLLDYTTAIDPEKPTKRRFTFTITRTRRQMVRVSVLDLRARCPVCDQDVELSLSTTSTGVAAPEAFGCAVSPSQELRELDEMTGTHDILSERLKEPPS
jgi:hypothetical protein